MEVFLFIEKKKEKFTEDKGCACVYRHVCDCNDRVVVKGKTQEEIPYNPRIYFEIRILGFI